MPHIVLCDSRNFHILLYTVPIVNRESIADLQMFILGDFLCDNCSVIV